MYAWSEPQSNLFLHLCLTLKVGQLFPKHKPKKTKQFFKKTICFKNWATCFLINLPSYHFQCGCNAFLRQPIIRSIPANFLFKINNCYTQKSDLEQICWYDRQHRRSSRERQGFNSKLMVFPWLKKTSVNTD